MLMGLSFARQQVLESTPISMPKFSSIANSVKGKPPQNLEINAYLSGLFVGGERFGPLRMRATWLLSRRCFASLGKRFAPASCCHALTYCFSCAADLLQRPFSFDNKVKLSTKAADGTVCHLSVGCASLACVFTHGCGSLSPCTPQSVLACAM